MAKLSLLVQCPHEQYLQAAVDEHFSVASGSPRVEVIIPKEMQEVVGIEFKQELCRKELITLEEKTAALLNLNDQFMKLSCPITATDEMVSVAYLGMLMVQIALRYLSLGYRVSIVY